MENLINDIINKNKENSQDKEIKELKEKITNLEILIITKFDELNAKLDNINKTSTKMSEHIDFIEETYVTLKTPLNFVKNKVERLMGYSGSSSLPSIKDKDDNQNNQ